MVEVPHPTVPEDRSQDYRINLMMQIEGGAGWSFHVFRFSFLNELERDNMNETKKLAFILKFLNDEWDKVVTILTVDQRSYLQQELETLETDLQDSPDDDTTASISRNFIPVFSNIKPLEFISNVESGVLRSGVLEEMDVVGADVLLDYIGLIKERF